MHTAFSEKLEGGLGGVLDHADAKTRDLFSRYLRHCEQIFLEAAQDPEEVIELRFSDPSGCSYVAAAHHSVFGDSHGAGGSDSAGDSDGAGGSDNAGSSDCAGVEAGAGKRSA